MKIFRVQEDFPRNLAKFWSWFKTFKSLSKSFFSVKLLNYLQIVSAKFVMQTALIVAWWRTVG